MSVPDELNQPKEGDKVAHLVEALGGLLVIILAAWFLLFYLGKEQADVFGVDTETASTTMPKTREEMIDQMSTKAETPVVISENEKEKMFEAMSQQIVTTGSASRMSGPTAPAPLVTPAERQKMLDAMQQKVDEN
ncbi:MAG: hypothetical protein AAB869_00485 [Patescibacteria group bacterium]